MLDVPLRTVTVRVEAARLETRGAITHEARCPICRTECVDVDGVGAGCCHLKELDLSRSGSYFTFEREVLA